MTSPKTISSLTNGDIKKVVMLHTAGGRYQHNMFIAQGLRTIKTLVTAGVALEHIYCTQDALATVDFISHMHVTLVTEPIMHKISTVLKPSGMLAVFYIPDQLSIHQLTPGIVLADIRDPGNMGTLIRTAAAMNVKSVIIVDGVDPWNPKVVQASAGAIGNVHVFILSWFELLEAKKQLLLYALVPQNGTSIKAIDTKRALLVVGNEAHGISPAWLESCDTTVTLAMPGNTESLNAAIAGSIALYEVFTTI